MQTSAIGGLPSISNTIESTVPNPLLGVPLAGISSSPLTLEALLSLQLQNSSYSNFWNAIETLIVNSAEGISQPSKLLELLRSLNSGTQTRLSPLYNPFQNQISPVISLQRIGSLALEEEIRLLQSGVAPRMEQNSFLNMGITLLNNAKEETTKFIEGIRPSGLIFNTDASTPNTAILPGVPSERTLATRETNVSTRNERLAPRPFRYEKEGPRRNRRTKQPGRQLLQRFLGLVRNFARLLSGKQA
jgi:hypothetical protein